MTQSPCLISGWELLSSITRGGREKGKKIKMWRKRSPVWLCGGSSPNHSSLWQEPADLSKQFPVLAEDFHIPQFFTADQFFSSVFRISSCGLQLWTHYDVSVLHLVSVYMFRLSLFLSPVGLTDWSTDLRPVLLQVVFLLLYVLIWYSSTFRLEDNLLKFLIF